MDPDGRFRSPDSQLIFADEICPMQGLKQTFFIWGLLNFWPLTLIQQVFFSHFHITYLYNLISIIIYIL